MRILVYCFALLAAACLAFPADYFPPPDNAGGWRTAVSAPEARDRTGIDVTQLDQAFDYIKGSTKNGGLVVVRHGWLVYEKYFGHGQREATPNTGSVGKSFTSIAVGILVGERPDLFPDGLDQRVFTERFMPPIVFPLSDPRKNQIKLGQLLAMTAGIRGNNPGIIRGRQVILDPPGPDGWSAMVDAVAAGKQDGKENAITLWVEPGGGYSYATASAHLASMMVRHVSGMELEEYIERKIALPLGWGRWGFGYQRPEITHTPGGGGIALRATDMMRFLYLLLHEGRWGKDQVVPADYVRHCGRRSPYNPHTDYSLEFTVNAGSEAPEAPRDAYWKQGSGGHCIYVVPSLDLVVFKLGGRDGQYDPKQLDVAVPAFVRDHYDGSRENWKPEVDAGTAARRTLELVVAAVSGAQ